MTTRPLKFLRLPSAERWLLVKAAVLLVVIRFGLGLLPFHTFRRLLAKLATASAGVQKTDPSFEERVGWAVGVASRHPLGTGTCLSQALAAQELLTRRGHPALLRIGVVRGQEGELVAHAWSKGRDRVVVGGSELRALHSPRGVGGRRAVGAIAGIFFPDGRRLGRATLEQMVDNLAHRGPDGAGAWSEGSVGLGHRMLWTTPQSLREKLPLVKGSRDLIITADARLDNREELIVALGLGGRPREEVADSELILGAYERWDERCPERLLGDFAFAIWDRRRQEVFCARDHMGVKPLYYYRSDRAFVFASEIKAILCVPGVPRRLNEVRVADYLVTAVEDKEITFYQGILRLPPAHSMTVNREGISKRSYWSLDSSREVRFRSDQEYAEAYREVFTEAVSCRLRSAFPVGSHLSGGLDSSSIACVARELLESDGDRQLHTISAIFEDLPQCDERPFIGAVLDQGRLEPHFVKDADLLSPLANLDRVLWHEDEPFVVAHLTMFWSLCRAAHQQGARIFLRGDGGDNTVSYGLTYLRELALMGRWMTMATEIHGLCRHSHFSPCSPWSLLLRYVLRPLAPEPVRRAWRMLRRRNRPPWAVDTVIRLDFARRVGLAERYQTLERAHMSPARTLREEHWLDLTGGEHAAWLEVCERISAAFSIEDRYPFYDRRLLEFCLALPPEQKLNKGWTRVVARRALSGTLPKEVQWRSSKGNLSPAFHQGLLTADRVFLERVISEDLQLIEPYVDVAALRETYHRYRLEPTNAAGFTIWSAVTLAFWLRQTGLTG